MDQERSDASRALFNDNQLLIRARKQISLAGPETKVRRFKIAYRLIKAFAEIHDLNEEWCDLTFNLMLEARVGRWIK